MSMSKLRFFSPWMMQVMEDYSPYEDLGFDLDRMRRWHPLNRELAMGARIQLAGLLLNAKGDRVAMNSSVETRYPFLDEEVFDFLAKVPPRWKLRGLRDKALLRVVAERWLPRSIARRRKAMFRAPFDSFQLEHGPEYVGQLLSPESLRRTGYFQAEAVEHWRKIVSASAPLVAAAGVDRDGPGRRAGHAVMASHVHRRQPGRFAVAGLRQGRRTVVSTTDIHVAEPGPARQRTASTSSIVVRNG